MGPVVAQLPSSASLSAVSEPELGTHVDSAEMTAQLDQLFRALGGLSAEEVADVVAYAASRARHVNLRQIMVLPTRQA